MAGLVPLTGALEAELAAFLEPSLTELADEWYHTYRSTRSREGFPDYTVVLGGWLLFIELKRSGGAPTDAQARWLWHLRGPQRLCLLVGGAEGVTQLLGLLRTLRRRSVDPVTLGAASLRVQVLGTISAAGVASVGDVPPAAPSAAADGTTPRQRRRRCRR